MKFSHLAVLAVLLHTSDAFVTPYASKTRNQISSINDGGATDLQRSPSISARFAHEDDLSDDVLDRKRPSKLRRIFSNAKKSVAFVTLASSVLTSLPKGAQASAPVMAIPKAEARDPLTEALDIHQRKMQAQAQQELNAFSAKGREIEASEGPDARARFEAQYKANQDAKAQERLNRIRQTKYDLLDRGICPFTDMEGQRRVFEAEKGLDPATVPGTPFFMERDMAERRPEKSYAHLKQHNRAMVKAMVTDMKNRDMDPLEYFRTHQDKIAGILELPAVQAAAYANRYNQNLEMYGQISPPKEGEMSVKEKMAQSPKASSADVKQQSNDLEEKIKAEKAAAKQKAKELKEKAKAEAKAAKEEAKALAKAAKDEAKKQLEAAKAATAAAIAAATSAAVGVAEATEQLALDALDTIPGSSSDIETLGASPVVESEGTSSGEESLSESGKEEAKSAVSVAKSSQDKKGIPTIPIAGGVIAVTGGGYAFKVMRDKAIADEEERQRQFKLLMGGFSSPPALEEVDDVDSDTVGGSWQTEASTPKPSTAPAQSSMEAAQIPKKKKKRGVFAKKTNGRETDIDVLVSNTAKAPEFAKLLAKILTYGAPGRFPGIVAIPGKMPMAEFNVDEACAMLTSAQEDAYLSKQEAAEVFANVVNCMLIDIVDLASTSLKEKDEKVSVDAIGIVVDFMMHASSLYNSIAEGVVITPVTYGGDLRKGTLEQLFSAYAASGMTNFMNLDEDFENRVSLLQDVFQINEKKAEGLMMKAVQKKMMDALKSGEGLEGMEEMMKGMDMDALGGLGGIGGPGSGEEMDPEQLKEMLKQLKAMKDAGAIPADQMKEVRDAFKEAYGATIDDVIKEADAEGELGTQDKELLSLMKSVLYDE